MKILMLSPRWPIPANTGGLVRIFQVFCGLGTHMEVTMVTPQGVLNYYGNKLNVEPWDVKKHDLFHKVTSWFSHDPYHVRLYHSEAMQRKVDSLLAKDYSLAYCHFIYTIPYLKNVKIPIVLDQQNVDRQYWRAKTDTSKGVLKLASWVNLQKTVAFENQWLGSLNTIVSVSEKDSIAMQSYASKHVKNFWVAPNGVDINTFQSSKNKINRGNRKIRLGFMGSFDMQLNCDAALRLYEEILPDVKKQLPDIELTLTLIGRNPPLKISQLAARDPNLVLPGTVPDVVPYLDTIDIFIAPLVGGAGTKLRIFEAMAMKLPIIASPDATQGIDELVDGQNILLAKNTQEFSNAIVMLIKDVDQRHRLGRVAHRLVMEKYNWENITRELAKNLALLVN